LRNQLQYIIEYFKNLLNSKSCGIDLFQKDTADVMDQELNPVEYEELITLKNYSFAEFSASPHLMEKYVIAKLIFSYPTDLTT